MEKPEQLTRGEIHATSDFVSVHYRLGERSRHLIGGEHFAKMKPTAYLINTSRGEILRENELIAALEKKQLAGAGLDVFAEEPLAKDHPFRKMENVVITPHIGYVTTEYLTNAYRQTMEDIVAFMDGKPIRIQPYRTVNID